MLNSDLSLASSSLVRQIKQKAPFFLGRIGGSDTNALVDYLRSNDDDQDKSEHIARWLPIVKRYNGFYSFNAEVEDYKNYIDSLFEDYKKCDFMTACNFQLLSLYFPKSIHAKYYKDNFDNKIYFQKLMQSLGFIDSARKCLLPYSFIERGVSSRHSLFNVFAESLSGLDVLVISPFSASIVSNYGNRNSFFREPYKYPEFNLQTVDTPITYAGLPKSFYPHNSWFETLAFLESEIECMQFDIALLSCGTYAMPLGRYIHEKLHKSAIYVGGLLQIYFGIMGRRYEDNHGLLAQINPSDFIYPLEKKKYFDHVEIGESAATEAFGAYF